ncbi:MAG: BrnT family toxin [Nostoc sp.]|uniref:BrnT family toxin n=1 Tax=unclassified Nostoc TaxID=2593658 RepID=UPI0021D51D7C|nr:BrnT family toxin [Nostoc sp. 'Peltigera membranacea cyanobiont' 232]
MEEVFEGDTVTVKDDRFNYGEERFITFGLIEGRVIAVVHTERDNLIRIISARKSTKNEEIRYFQQIAD